VETNDQPKDGRTAIATSNPVRIAQAQQPPAATAGRKQNILVTGARVNVKVPGAGRSTAVRNITLPASVPALLALEPNLV
jgi:hypothetical protein